MNTVMTLPVPKRRGIPCSEERVFVSNLCCKGLIILNAFLEESETTNPLVRILHPLDGQMNPEASADKAGALSNQIYRILYRRNSLSAPEKMAAEARVFIMCLLHAFTCEMNATRKTD